MINFVLIVVIYVMYVLIKCGIIMRSLFFFCKLFFIKVFLILFVFCINLVYVIFF